VSCWKVSCNRRLSLHLLRSSQEKTSSRFAWPFTVSSMGALPTVCKYPDFISRLLGYTSLKLAAVALEPSFGGIL